MRSHRERSVIIVSARSRMNGMRWPHVIIRRRGERLVQYRPVCLLHWNYHHLRRRHVVRRRLMKMRNSRGSSNGGRQWRRLSRRRWRRRVEHRQLLRRGTDPRPVGTHRHNVAPLQRLGQQDRGRLRRPSEGCADIPNLGKVGNHFDRRHELQIRRRRRLMLLPRLFRQEHVAEVAVAGEILGREIILHLRAEHVEQDRLVARRRMPMGMLLHCCWQGRCFRSSRLPPILVALP